jgi:hypothetical protein
MKLDKQANKKVKIKREKASETLGIVPNLQTRHPVSATWAV